MFLSFLQDCEKKKLNPFLCTMVFTGTATYTCPPGTSVSKCMQRHELQLWSRFSSARLSITLYYIHSWFCAQSVCVAMTAKSCSKELDLAGQPHGAAAHPSLKGMTAQSSDCINSSSKFATCMKAGSTFKGRKSRRLSNHSKKIEATGVRNLPLLIFYYN